MQGTFLANHMQRCKALIEAQMVKNLPAMWEARVRSLGQEDPLEEEIETHSRILAWRIPWTQEPGGLQSMGSQRGRHDWVTNTFKIGILMVDVRFTVVNVWKVLNVVLTQIWLNKWLFFPSFFFSPSSVSPLLFLLLILGRLDAPWFS